MMVPKARPTLGGARAATAGPLRDVCPLRARRPSALRPSDERAPAPETALVPPEAYGAGEGRGQRERDQYCSVTLVP